MPYGRRVLRWDADGVLGMAVQIKKHLRCWVCKEVFVAKPLTRHCDACKVMNKQKYWIKNKERVLEKNRCWREQNRARYNATETRRYHRRRQEFLSMTPEEILKRVGYKIRRKRT